MGRDVQKKEQLNAFKKLEEVRVENEPLYFGINKFLKVLKKSRVSSDESENLFAE